MVPSPVLKTMGVMQRVHRAFEAFDDPDRDLAWFVEYLSTQFLVPWSHGKEPGLA
jgi:hypothetical protein